MKTIKWLFAVVMFTLLASFAAFAKEAKNSTISGMDVIIVVDTSNSMKSTDPNRISIEAAKMFIDMMEANGSRVGLIGFSSAINKKVPLTELNNQQDKKSLQAALDALTFTGETDIGLALKEANALFNSEGESFNKKMILFFTDGKIEFFGGQGANGRTVQASKEDVESVIAQVKEEFPIYTIGLNSNGNVDTSLIQGIADNTKARNYVVDSASELPNIFNEIFADFVKSNIINVGTFTTDGVNETQVPIEIPNNSVAEANIVMLSTDILEKVTLIDPDGQEVRADGNKLISSISKSYSMLKIITPKQGNWTLNIKGSPGCEIHVNMLFNYDIALTMELNRETTYTIGSNVPISGYLVSEQGNSSEDAFYNLFKASAVVTNPDGITKEYPMMVEEHRFYTELPVEQLGDYNIYLKADGESFYRTTEEELLTIGNHAPIATDELPKNVVVKGFFLGSANSKLDLSKWFTDNDGDVLQYNITIADGQDYIESQVKDSQLLLKGLKKGEVPLVVTASDPLGESIEVTIPVTISYTLKSAVPLIVGILAVLFCIVVGIVVIKAAKVKSTRFFGAIDYYAEKETTVGLPDEQHRRLAGEKGSIRLNKVVRIPESKSMELEKIVLYPHFDRKNGIKVINNSKCEVSAGFGSNKKSFILFDGESCSILCDLGNRKISVHLTYHEGNR